MTAKKETRVRSVTSLERSTFRPKTDHRHAGSPSLPRPVPREAAWLLALWARPTPTPSLPPQDRNHVSVAKRESPTSLEDTIGDTHEITLTFSAIEIEELEREERKMGLVGFFFFFSKTRSPHPAAPFSVHSKHVASSDHVTWRRAGQGARSRGQPALRPRGHAHAQPRPASLAGAGSGASRVRGGRVAAPGLQSHVQ